MKRIGRYFLQGLLVVAPLGVTAYVVYVVFKFIDGLLSEWIYSFLMVRIPGLGLVTIFLLITLLGFITQSILFRPVKKLMTRILKQFPLLKVIYSSIQDLLSAFVGKDKKFTYPVLVRVNNISNLHKLGFLTQKDLSRLGKTELVAVYFPHSYNFSGELFLVPSGEVTPLDLPSAEAMKFIVSGGVTHI
ncbi:MAG TPA: DUF502 domain-containing protein [Bacteroidetes bacterium]|nr:DUF502 domain-containing protein [Bacteroidota bacterium]